MIFVVLTEVVCAYQQGADHSRGFAVPESHHRNEHADSQDLVWDQYAHDDHENGEVLPIVVLVAMHRDELQRLKTHEAQGYVENWQLATVVFPLAPMFLPEKRVRHDHEEPDREQQDCSPTTANAGAVVCAVVAVPKSAIYDETTVHQRLQLRVMAFLSHPVVERRH